MFKHILAASIAGFVAFAPVAGQAQQRTLTVYSSLDEDQAKALIKGFEAKHPQVKVNAILGSTAPIIARVIAEAASPQADIIMGNAVSALMAADARGLLVCTVELDEPGEIELVVVASDGQGRESRAASTVYVTRQGELWFGGEDHDRIDVLPEKKRYEPGETARFQVRSPFRFATALVTVER